MADTTTSPYYQRVIGGKLSEQVNDPQMQQDMVDFFKSSRYGYTKEDFAKMGPQGVYDAFAEHMRYQENNSYTAARDLFFVNDTTGSTDKERAAFGRLMQAWDNSEGEDMSLTKAWDYVAANVTDPVNIATVATAGITSAAKVAAQGGGIAARMAIRKAAAAALAKETVKGSFIKGAAIGGISNAAMSAGFDVTNQATRGATIDNYEYSPAQTAGAAVGGALIGGAIGGVSRTMSSRSATKLTAMMDVNDAKSAAAAVAGNKKASAKLKTTRKEIATDIVAKMNAILEVEADRATKIQKDAIPKDLVARGELVQKILNGDKTVENLTVGRLTAGSMRRVAAAMSDIADKINYDPKGSVRISTAMANAIEDETSGFTSEVFTKMIDEYGVTRSDFSALIAAEYSQAGKTLQSAGALAKALSKDAKKALEVKRKQGIDDLTKSVMSLASRGIITQNTDQVEAMSKQAKLHSNAFYKFLQSADSMRVGFMTSQIATTSANFSSGVGRIGVDFLDRVFENTVKLRNPLSGAFDMLKGLTYGADETEMLYQMGARDIPDQLKYMLNDITRVENALDGPAAAGTGVVSKALDTTASGMTKIARVVNTLNAVSDNTFKNAAFYASINRQLKDRNDGHLGVNFMDFLKKKTSLESLPPEMVTKAADDALRYTFQRTYIGEETAYAKGVRGVIKLHRSVPFLLSSGLPFPRFVANQIEFIHDYTPLLGLAGMARSSLNGAVDNKTFAERVSRQFTGAALLASAYAWRVSQGADTKATEHVDHRTGEVKELSRIGGPLNSFLVLGDLIMRYTAAKAGEDVYIPRFDKAASDLFDAAIGTSILPDKTSSQQLVKSIQDGKLSDGAKKVLDDVIATFTYPVAVVNDLMGQANPAMAVKPFTKSLTGEGLSPNEVDEPLVSLFGIIDITASDFMRATRFMPDTPFIHIAQSDVSGYDLSLLNPFSNTPIKEIDPGLKQLTAIKRTAERSELQKEMVKMGIEEYEAFRTSGQRANPNVEYAVRWMMSTTKDKKGQDTPANFIKWKENNTAYQKAGPDQKKLMLQGFIADEVNKATSAAVEAFSRMAALEPKRAAGYIRNMYLIKKKELESDLADATVKGFTGQTMNEYVAGAKTVEDELDRKLHVMKWLGQVVK